MMAIINQKMGKAQGVANSKLYSLASNATTYASAFHDITSGNNGCSGAGTTVCPTTSPAFSVYAAGSGYDMATGLGSINFNNLLTAWSGSAAAKSFTVSATNVTVVAGSNGTSTVTITPVGGYTGTISWAVSSSPSSTDVCFSMPNTAVSSATPVAPTLTIKTSASACGTAAITDGGGKEFFAGVLPEGAPGWPGPLLGRAQIGLALVAIVLLLIGRRESRALRVCGWALILVAAGLVNGGCSGASTSAPPSGNAAKGTYTVTLKGTDTTTSSITATTTMTLTID